MKPLNIKEWLWSAKVLTTIVWIIFPLGYITATTIIDIWNRLLEVSDPYAQFYLPFPHYTHSPPPFSIGIPPIVLLIVLFPFAVFPAVYPSEKFFRKRGEANAVFEYQYIKKIIYISLAVLIIIIISLYYVQSRTQLNRELSEFVEKYGPLHIVLYDIAFMLPAVPTFLLLKLLLEHARKQFRCYYAKVCFKLINETKSEADNAEYLILGLGWYNKFVKRVTKSSIDIETIYSKILSNSPLSNNILLDTIKESFNRGDELKLMRHMLTLLSCWKEGGATLVKESLRTKLKESTDLLIPIVTVIITVIATFFLKPPSQ